MADMQQSDLSNLPPDVQAQIAGLLRQKGISGQLMSSALAPVPNEVIAGRVIPTGGGQLLAKALSAYFGNRGLEKADEGIAGIRQADLERYNTKAKALTGGDKNAWIAGQASEDPRIAAVAAALLKRHDERAGKYADLKKDVDAPGAANDFYSDTMTPTGGFQQPKITPVDFAGRSVPAVTNFGEGGRPTMTVPALTSISQSTGGKAESAAAVATAGKIPDVVKDAATRAAEAIESVRASDRITELLKNGEVISGFAAEPRIGLANFGKLMGWNDGEAVQRSQEMMSALANQTLASVKRLTGAITEKEKPFLELASAGKIDFSPESFQRLADLAKIQGVHELKYARKQWSGGIAEPGAEANATLFPFPEIGEISMDPTRFETVGGPGSDVWQRKSLPVKSAAPAPLESMTLEQLKARRDALRKTAPGGGQ